MSGMIARRFEEGALDRIRKLLAESEPSIALEKWITENNATIQSSGLDIGRKIVSERTAIYTELVRRWAQEQQAAFTYNRPFSVVALGGTGRAEMTPYSDTDFAFLFDEILEGNDFLLELQRQVIHTNEFATHYGFQCEVLPFSLNDIPSLDGKQLNSFIDMRPVYDPEGLAETFLERIRSTYNPFDHFLHVRNFWLEQWEAASLRSEDFDRFDIKNDGLRVFLAGIWTLAGNTFCHSHEIYESLEDPRELAAYEFLLRIRAFVHSQRNDSHSSAHLGNHPEDIMTFDDFTSFGKMLGTNSTEEERFNFGNEVRSRIFESRRRIALFTRRVIRKELAQKRWVSKGSSIVYGLGGLHLQLAQPATDPENKSRLALSLLLAAQHYRTPIDHLELHQAFGNAEDWLTWVPELASLFYESEGSLADTFEFLSQVIGAEERLFPGYGKFESSLDGRLMIERTSLRGKLQRKKLRALEKFLITGRSLLHDVAGSHGLKDSQEELNIAIEAALLEPDKIAAIKLALKTKRLPLTHWDQSLRGNTSYPFHERFASGFSGIPLEEYYQPFVQQGGFSEAVIEEVKFLIEHRSVFLRTVLSGPNDVQQVREFADLCGSEERLRMLFVFFSADHVEWNSEEKLPAQWFNIRELYTKTQQRFRPGTDSTRYLAAAGYSQEEQEILKDFGQDFFDGMYRSYANRFGPHLLRLAENSTFNGCKVGIARNGASTILGVAARDARGLAATLTGLLWQQGIGLQQAHLFSSINHQLALDFFHLENENVKIPAQLPQLIEERIHEGLPIQQAVGAPPLDLKGQVALVEWRPGQYCLKYEGAQNSGALIYTLTYKLLVHLQADIFGLNAYKSRQGEFVSVYINLPTDLSFDDARKRVVECF